MSTTARRLLELGSNGKPTFTYRKASETDLAATFARIRREQRQAAAVDKPSTVVRQLRKQGGKP